MSCNTITITQNCCPGKCGCTNGSDSNEEDRFEQLSLAISQDLTNDVSSEDYQAVLFNTEAGLTLTNAVVENGYVKNKITGGISTNSWNQNAGNLPVPKTGIYSTIVIEDTVYIVGGYGGDNWNNGFTQVYKKTVADFIGGTGTWAENGSLPGTFEGAFSTIVIGDNVYILGGYDWSNNIPTSVVYRKSVTDFVAGTGSWTSSGNLPTATALALSSIVINDTIYILGGSELNTSGFYSQVYKKPVADFVTGTGTWTVNGSLPAANTNAMSTIVIGNTVYVLGGQINQVTFYTQVYQKPVADFIAGTGTWVASGSLPTSAAYGLSPIVIDDSLYVLGGDIGDGTGYSAVKSLTLEKPEYMVVKMPVFELEQGTGIARIYFMAKDEDKAISDTIGNDQLKLYVSVDNDVTYKPLSLTVRDDLDDYAIAGTKWIASEDFDLTGQTGIVAKIFTQVGSIGEVPNIKIYHFNDFILSK